MHAAAAPLNAAYTLCRDDIRAALSRIAPHIYRTPLLESSLLNGWLGHEIIFKAEGLQKIGAFKTRGALNALLSLKERGKLTSRVVAYSSGNHAQAVAYGASLLGIHATVVMPKFVSQVKQNATRDYGAELILTDTRPEAEALALKLAAEGAYFIHPSDDDAVIAGQGTAALEALEDGANPDAVFAACGGGGLLAGTYLAAENIQVFGAEPKMANDAAQSLRAGRIIGFDKSPMSIADGARTLRISERTYHYLKKLAGFYEIEERDIIYWTQWLTHLLKIQVEPTAALSMAAAHQWLKTQKERKRVLVILSGANLDAATERAIWQESFLTQLPQL
jgi:threo-3-hydroxy-L-aspartate ammonia-lyase